MSVKRKFMLSVMVMLAAAMFIYPYASAQIAIEPVCKTCFPNDCYSYKDCKPLEGTCKTGKCCQGTCTIVPNSTDAKVNYIGDQLVEMLKKTDAYLNILKKGTLVMHGTEYIFGQTGKVWLQLLDSNNTEVLDAVCFVDIYNPDGTEYIEQATMTNMLHDGIYYYDLNIPNVEGVYPSIARCYYEAGQDINLVTSISYTNSTYTSGSLSNTYTLDGTYLNTEELSNVTPRRYGSELSLSNGYICSNISELLLTGVTIYWNGRWNSNIGGDYMTISIYNYSSSSWIDLPNTITGVGTGSKTVTNSFSFSNITRAGLVNSTGSNARLKFTDTNLTDGSATRFDYDYVYVSCDRLTSPDWIEVRGSSEIHVSKNYSDMLYRAIISTNDTVKSVNYTLFSKIQESIALMTATNQSLYNFVSYVNQSIYNRLDSVETNIRGDISSVNASTMNYLYGIKGDLTSVLNDIQDVYNLVEGVNTSIQNRLDSISNDIDSLGTQIDNVNVSLYNKIDQMTSDLAYQLANISEISVNITGDLTEVANDVWTLFFRRGTPPLAPSTDYYCEANDSNILNKNITYEFVNDDGSIDYFSKVEKINCGFGCIEGGFMESHAICDYDPTTKGIVAIIIVIIIGAVMYFAIKHTGGEE
jgi:hypothetical protein